jgi:transposase
MKEFSPYVGLDVHAASISIRALAAGRDGEELFAGTIAATPEALSRLIAKVKKRGRALFCHEAGCRGYGIYRQIVASGEACQVIAPSLIPRKPGEPVKTDRRDARKQAGLPRAGELTAIWVPDEAHEAMRDLLRLRHQAVRARVAAQPRLTSFLPRLGRRAPCRRWTRAYRVWLSQQSFDEPAHGSCSSIWWIGSPRPRQPPSGWRRRCWRSRRPGAWPPWSRPCGPCAAST